MLLLLYGRLCAIVKSVRCYVGTPLPLWVGSLRRYSRVLQPIRKDGCLLLVLRTSFSVRLYAAFMRAYAAYRRPQNIEFHSIKQKNTHFLAYVQFL